MARPLTQAEALEIPTLSRPDIAWRGKAGEMWASRNPVNLDETNKVFADRYGVSKTEVVEDLLSDVDKSELWMEAGCSAGAFMRVMESAGVERVYGFDICLAPLARATPGCVVQADASQMPFADNSFNICTSGTLTACGPEDRLALTVREIGRVCRRWLLVIEPWSPKNICVVFSKTDTPEHPPCWLFQWQSLLPEYLPGWVWHTSDLLPLPDGPMFLGLAEKPC